MEKYYLKFENQSKMFYVLDSVITEFINSEKTPLLVLSDDDYIRLGVSVPDENAPVVGLLMGRSGDCYSAGWNYVLAIARTGARIVFLTYHHFGVQMAVCEGIVFPGGAFESSELYYADPKNDEEFVSIRQMAYTVCIRLAVEKGLPILGICAGAQMVAGVFNLKLYRSFDYVETPIKHNSRRAKAHLLRIFAKTPLAQILGENMIPVNSRHSELVAPWRVQRELWAQAHHLEPEVVRLPLDIYAEANDGTPEAWGSDEKRILCVQWHPEDMAAAGDEKMQAIYQWLVDRIREKARSADGISGAGSSV